MFDGFQRLGAALFESLPAGLQLLVAGFFTLPLPRPQALANLVQSLAHVRRGLHHVAGDQPGDGLAVVGDGREVVLLQQLLGDRRWQPAQLLSDPRSTVQASFPALAVDAAGSVTAVWQQYNGWRDIVVTSRLP